MDQRSREFLYMTSYSIAIFGIDMYVVLGNRCKCIFPGMIVFPLVFGLFLVRSVVRKKKEEKEMKKEKQFW